MNVPKSNGHDTRKNGCSKALKQGGRCRHTTYIALNQGEMLDLVREALLVTLQLDHPYLAGY